MANPIWLSRDGRWELTARWSDQCDLAKEARTLQADGWEAYGPPLGAWQVRWEDSVPRYWIDFRRPVEGGGESPG